ncbi:MAG TPA: DUF1573 domain-containing protein [Chitinophagaceae bacterium]|nr:DUF1573 domain-containing protein [Chitinophagaceae bacterium]
MKKAVVALSLLFMSVAVLAQNAVPAQKKAEDFVKFKDAVHDFGKIKQNVPVTYDFQFTNISAQPVIVENAQATCGCTKPTWPEAAIAKGKSDKITAGFNAQTLGTFTKQITVKLAGVDIPYTLTITGEVLTAEDYAKYEATKKDRNSSKPGSR